MSYTAKPQFTGLGGNVNTGQSQQPTGQPKPHGEIPLQNFPQTAAVQNPQAANTNVTNHPIASPGSVTMTAMNRQQLQQQQQQFANLHQNLLFYQQLQQQQLGVNTEPLGMCKTILKIYRTEIFFMDSM